MIFTDLIGGDNGGNDFLWGILIIGEELLGVFGQAITAVTE